MIQSVTCGKLICIWPWWTQCFVFALAFDVWTLYARHVLVLHWTFLCVLAPYGVVHFNIDWLIDWLIYTLHVLPNHFRTSTHWWTYQVTPVRRCISPEPSVSLDCCWTDKWGDGSCHNHCLDRHLWRRFSGPTDFLALVGATCEGRPVLPSQNASYASGGGASESSADHGTG